MLGVVGFEDWLGYTSSLSRASIRGGRCLGLDLNRVVSFGLL